MTEQEIRALVREAIARQADVSGTLPSSHLRPPVPSPHASFALFVLPSGADSEGPCIIEPSVMCNHCGYCKSYGH